MGTKDEKWYGQVYGIFRELKLGVGEANFMRLFAGPMCIPANGNYGKTEEERAGSAKEVPKHRSPDAVRRDQDAVLKDYETWVGGYTAKELSVANELRNMADGVMELATMCREKAYAIKNSAYRPAPYLRYFTGKTPASSGAYFQKAAELYGKILKKAFEMEPETLRVCLKNLKAAFEASDGKLPVPEEKTEDWETGSYLCALLIVAAAESCDDHRLPKELFDILPPCEATGTRSVEAVKTVTLKGEQFFKLFDAVLMGEPELPVLETAFYVLREVVDKLKTKPGPEMFIRIEKLRKALFGFKTRIHAALGSKDFGEDTQEEEEMLMKVAELLQSCKAWMENCE